MPSIFSEDLFDDFFAFPKTKRRELPAMPQLMHTDIRESDDGFEISMNLPGYKKENVSAELKDGYLTIKAETSSENEEKDDKFKYVRKERYVGSCSRAFYVGEDITEEDIKARFEDGVLKLQIPKKEAKPAVEEKKFIPIE